MLKIHVFTYVPFSARVYIDLICIYLVMVVLCGGVGGGVDLLVFKQYNKLKLKYFTISHFLLHHL